MNMRIVMGFAAAVSVILAACGGSGGSGSTANNSGSENVTATELQVVAAVRSSNIEFFASLFSSALNPTLIPGTWRWSGTPVPHVTVYVAPPASGDATELNYASMVQTSITTINRKLTGLVVLDAVGAVPASGNYIYVSYGTSYVPAGSTNYQNYCANVATGQNVGNMIQPDSSGGMASSPVFINIGNGHCTVSQDIVTHEFGHALGLTAHFNGFGGDGPPISTAFWDVLATLYANPQLTAESGLTVHRAAN